MTRYPPIHKFLAPALVLTALLVAPAGCSFAFEFGKGKKNQQPTTVPSDVPQARIVAEIPRDAALVGKGAEPMRYTAEQSGTIYVFSRDDRQVSLQYDLTAGETFTLEPIPDDGTRFTADRHTSAGSGTIPPSRGGYEVYFQPKGTAPTTSPAEMAPGS